MRFVCDVHIPLRLKKRLTTLGWETWHVNELVDGSETADASICAYADTHDCIVSTKDSDFRNSYFLRKTPKKLIRICLGNVSNDLLISSIEKLLSRLLLLTNEPHFYLEIRGDQTILFD